MKCKNCKHWNSKANASAYLNVHAREFGTCQLHTYQGIDENISDKLARAASYGEPGDSIFVTRPEFGCISFEGKAL